MHFRDGIAFLFRDRGNRFFECGDGGRGELYLGGAGGAVLGGEDGAPDWRLNPGGHAQFGQLVLSLPSVMIKVKKVKTEETK